MVRERIPNRARDEHLNHEPAPAIDEHKIQSRSSDPRSIRARDAVLAATIELLDEGGLPLATVDAISARSGVSKVTIYRHWPNRTAVAAEAFGQKMAHFVEVPDTGDGIGDIRTHVRRVSAFYSTSNGTVFRQLMAACVIDPPAAPYFRMFFLDIRRQLIADLWNRAVALGVGDPNIDPETADDILFGPLIYRLMSEHKPLSEEEADLISSAALSGLSAK
ncbi:TetR/AcrR family transcriptional regulator [Mycetocola saprophilus]|uniref:TetR/AcrR family transcriptional regulator n=1 Tax=Mycetocola saprophilus TaxID=76636 RepID=UPI003BF42FFC